MTHDYSVARAIFVAAGRGEGDQGGSLNAKGWVTGRFMSKTAGTEPGRYITA